MLYGTQTRIPGTVENTCYPATSAFSTTWDTDANVILSGKIWVTQASDTVSPTLDSTKQVYLVASPSGKIPYGVQAWNIVKLADRQVNDGANGDQCVLDGNGVRYPATFLKQGKITTDEITGSPGFGDTAYIGASGSFTNFAGASGLIGISSESLATAFVVGKFVSDVDSTTGAAEIRINIL